MVPENLISSPSEGERIKFLYPLSEWSGNLKGSGLKPPFKFSKYNGSLEFYPKNLGRKFKTHLVLQPSGDLEIWLGDEPKWDEEFPAQLPEIKSKFEKLFAWGTLVQVKGVEKIQKIAKKLVVNLNATPSELPPVLFKSIMGLVRRFESNGEALPVIGWQDPFSAYPLRFVETNLQESWEQTPTYLEATRVEREEKSAQEAAQQKDFEKNELERNAREDLAKVSFAYLMSAHGIEVTF